MLISIVFRLLFLASLAATTPIHRRTPSIGSGNVIVGYKAVDKKKADAYNAAGTVVWFPPSGEQTGTGVYLTPGPGQWPGSAWNCAVWANSEKWEALKKVWVPEYDSSGNKLWYASQTVIDLYVRSFGFSRDSTVLLSDISGMDDTIQILLQQSMLKGGANDVGLGAVCVEGPGISKLPVTLPANWGTWDIEGLCAGSEGPAT
ncbi:hypothetical protein N7510_004710 [Penicillium lagena]|uniref:uncharacterized protein n=1 Tax=Penicillium lagena TaxID=94218 RepID=UPI002542161E|nr:uncharacterized protein N7510_004710 [Penicillium lagena]KAJ5620726.1 hypothetical protein N7510_004710 [Penicillium lagena]